MQDFGRKLSKIHAKTSFLQVTQNYSLFIIHYSLFISADEEDAEFVEGVDGKRDEE